MINILLHRQKPVLQLRDADQQLLIAALSGLTDDELARRFSLVCLLSKSAGFRYSNEHWNSGRISFLIGVGKTTFPTVASRNDITCSRTSVPIRRNCGRLKITGVAKMLADKAVTTTSRHRDDMNGLRFELSESF